MSDHSGLSVCAQHHPKKRNALTEKALSKKYKLPCGCETVTLQDLLDEYECTKCSEQYYYCFCIGDVVQSSETWYCEDCHTCRDAAEWHCETCGECSYGLGEPCDGCGATYF